MTIFDTIVLAPETAIRLGAFGGGFTLFALWEAIMPCRARVLPRLMRWRTNLLLIALNTGLGRLLAGAAPVAAAALAHANGIGLFNMVAAPAWLAFALSVLALDLVIYAQHVAFHLTPALWRFHFVHHADRDIDVTTGLRFHPGEIVISLAIKSVAAVLLGAPVAAVVAFEVILNLTAMFNHSNIALPSWLDRGLRLFLVTPDMHRVHHSIHRDETDSNYGFNLSLWDRAFGTYIPQPRDGHLAMTIGLPDLQSEAPARLLWILRAPFARPAGNA